MKAPEFRKAHVAVMGRVFSKEETDRFFDEALAFSEDRSALGVSSERDERGLLKRNIAHLDESERHALVCRRTTSLRTSANLSRERRVGGGSSTSALVEGAAEQLFEIRTPKRLTRVERGMADTKHRSSRRTCLFIARDLRKVVASMSAG